MNDILSVMTGRLITASLMGEDLWV